jgi:transcriptional regulator with XRE-family HTH domain
MKTRILEFLKAENKSSAQFADEIGVQPSSISHIISGRNNPSLDFVMKMLIKYPSLSTDWLLFGKGKMNREPQLNDLFNRDANDLINLNLDNTEVEDSNSLSKASVIASGTIAEARTDIGSNKSKRIIFFFEDGTFREYLPG